MALIYYSFSVRDSSITGDNRVTGLTPTWVALKALADNSNAAQPAISEVGSGLYKFAYDAEAAGEAVGQIDAGNTLTGGSDRYIDVLLTRDSSRIVTALPNESVVEAVVEATLGGGANDVIIATVDENGDPLAGVLVRARLNGSVQAEGISAHTDPEDASTAATVQFSLDNGTYRIQGERAGFSNPGLVDLVVDGDTEAEPYELTAWVPAETNVPGTVEFKVPLGKMLVAKAGVTVFINLNPGDGKSNIDVGGQIQYKGYDQGVTDAQGYATFSGPTSDVLEAAGASRRYSAKTVDNYIKENSWFEVTGPGVVTLNDPD